VTSEPAAGFAVKPTLTAEKVVLRPFLLEQDAPAGSVARSGRAAGPAG
jgi:hypothetical protein